ncbi:MAG: aminotransferase class I/II-fold pyridoxal phosphate-dependent enzyme [Spirochaetaceae bacterium]|jgi:threonine-phosphate decarboxylase|nr:aminotransferase class I/II-fold pyridoxal phosphate-dependent enzyme [Spirochaetaceae bacterium]
MLHGGDIFRNPGIILDYSVNTNPLGMPAPVRDALIRHVDDYGRYPDPLCGDLRSALARSEGLSEEQICCGNGAADLIFRLCLAVRPRHTLICAPAFSEYERAALLAGSRVSRHTLREENDFSLTESFIGSITADVDMVMLCNPNNPTGKIIPPVLLEGIRDHCRARNILLMADECFLPFTAGTSLAASFGKAGASPLAVLRAFTKTYSLAGIRLGYLLSNDTALVAAVMDTGQAWSVSAPAQYAGLAALEIPSWIEEARRLTGEERPPLVRGLRALGLRVIEGEANFILFRSETPLLEPLIRRGILIRGCGNFYGLDAAWYRIGVKKHEQNALLLAALEEVLHAR